MDLLSRCAEELRKLSGLRPDGIIQTQQVVEFARAEPGSAVADYFRRHGADEPEKLQELALTTIARKLLRKVKIVLLTPQQEPVRVRAYESLGPDRARGGGYRPIAHILPARDLRQALLETALRELLAVRRRYQHLSELDSVWAAVEAAQQPAA